jgi:ribulose-phosphate 3-epimerase
MALPILIAPSVLPADFSRLGDEVAALEKAGVDLIQWDVMDGQFVPNLTFGPDIIGACRDRVAVPFEAHLMVLTPDVLAPRYVEAGCQRLIVHAEACDTCTARWAPSTSSARLRPSRSTRRLRRRPSPTCSTSSTSCSS